MNLVSFWLRVITAEAFIAWAAGLSNRVGSKLSNDDKGMFSGGKKRNWIWYLWKYLEGLWSPNVEGNGWRKEGVENIYSLISQSLWTRFSDDLTCGAAFTADVVHTVCLLLDTRKGTFLQLLIFFFWIAQRKIFSLLPFCYQEILSFWNAFCTPCRSVGWSPTVKCYPLLHR